MALDISKAGTGLATGDASRPPHTAVFAFRGELPGMVFDRYRRWLLDMVALDKPDAIAYEAPLMQPAAKGSTQTFWVQSGLAVVTEMVSAAKGIRYERVHVQTARKDFLGHGRPDNPKDAVLRMCELLGWETGGDHNRGDAAAVWCSAHLRFGRTAEMRRLLSAGAVRNFAAGVR